MWSRLVLSCIYCLCHFSRSIQGLSLETVSRRHCLGTAAALLLPSTASAANETEEGSSMYAPTFVQSYPDFTRAPEGYSYKDVKPGNVESAAAEAGDRVVFDWSGVTIGYFGRPFQAKGGPQGGAFDKTDIDYSRTVLGSHTVIPALELAMTGMKAGQVRQIIVPFENNLSYPPQDLKHEKVGPKPNNFSGQRALNFVLENPRVDRTLLFNIKVIRVDKPNGQGGFARGA